MARRLTSSVVRHIKQLAEQRCPSKEIARHLGLSLSTVHKVRQGLYDGRLSETVRSCRHTDEEDRDRQAVWCEVCRCHVFPPCQACRLRALDRRGNLQPSRSQTTQHDPRLEVAVAQLALPLRIVNYLEQQGVLTVHDLLHCHAAQLRQAPNFGDKSLEQIYAALRRLGFVKRTPQSDSPATLSPPAGPSAKVNSDAAADRSTAV